MEYTLEHQRVGQDLSPTDRIAHPILIDHTTQGAHHQHANEQAQHIKRRQTKIKLEQQVAQVCPARAHQGLRGQKARDHQKHLNCQARIGEDGIHSIGVLSLEHICHGPMRHQMVDDDALGTQKFQ